MKMSMMVKGFGHVNKNYLKGESKPQTSLSMGERDLAL